MEKILNRHGKLLFCLSELCRENTIDKDEKDYLKGNCSKNDS